MTGARQAEPGDLEAGPAAPVAGAVVSGRSPAADDGTAGPPATASEAAAGVGLAPPAEAGGGLAPTEPAPGNEEEGEPA